jgi:hypothetical protein
MSNGEFSDTTAAEPGYLLGSLLIGGLVLPQLAMLGGFIAPRSRDEELYVGAYIVYIGFLFLSSYYWSHKTFALRGFMWICEHFSYPADRRMAFFYFALCAFLGFISILAGFGITQMGK